MSTDFDLDEVRKELDELQTPTRPSKFRIGEGKTTFCILPFEGKKYYKKVKMHFNVNGVTFECTGSDCIVCSQLHKLQLKIAGRVAAKQVYYVRVFNLDAKQVQVGLVPKSVMRHVFELVTTDYSDIVNYPECRPVIVIRSGSGLETRYTVMPGKERIKLELGELEDVKGLSSPPTEEQLSKIEALFTSTANPEAELESFFS